MEIKSKYNINDFIKYNIKDDVEVQIGYDYIKGIYKDALGVKYFLENTKGYIKEEDIIERIK